MAGKVWTNKDTEKYSGAPVADEYGPWTTPGAPASMRAIADSPADAIMAEAKRVANAPTVLSQYRDSLKAKEEAELKARSDEAANRAAKTLTPVGTAKRYTHEILNSPLIDYPLMAASMIPSPIAPAAGLVMSGKQLLDAATSPEGLTKTDMALAALGVIPELNYLRKGGAAGKLAREAEHAVGATRARVKNVYGAGDMGATPKPIDPMSFRNAPRRDPVWPSAGPQAGTPGRGAAFDDLASEATVRPNWRHPEARPAGPTTGKGPNPNISPELERLAAEADNFDNGAVASPYAYLDRQRAAAAAGQPGDWVPSAANAAAKAEAAAEGPGLAPAVQDYLRSRGLVSDVGASAPSPASVPVTRVPMGASGNEFAGVQPYGPSTKLDPTEAAAAPEWMDTELQQILDGIIASRR